jgi:hypothetical protein
MSGRPSACAHFGCTRVIARCVPNMVREGAACFAYGPGGIGGEVGGGFGLVAQYSRGARGRNKPTLLFIACFGPFGSKLQDWDLTLSLARLGEETRPDDILDLTQKSLSSGEFCKT